MLFQLLTESPLLILPWVVAVLLSIGWHEFSHALAGYWQGDDTAQRAGRLTANPFAHIDWMGFGLILLVGFGWGKPTPFNPYNLKFRKWGSTVVALAGPAANFVMAAIALSIYRGLGYTALSWTGSSNLLEVFLLFMAELNIMLGVFNLIPIPPLDGSKLLYALLGPSRQQLINRLEAQGPWLLLILILFGQGILSWLIQFVFVLVYRLFGLI
ncbi:MAG: site-2 protease family protein [Candidatus Kerfeldbacteria bacterium]|nr:site-2 protease family protein [Candidatus Kerfeldbacteria bacterium]